MPKGRDNMRTYYYQTHFQTKEGNWFEQEQKSFEVEPEKLADMLDRIKIELLDHMVEMKVIDDYSDVSWVEVKLLID